MTARKYRGVCTGILVSMVFSCTRSPDGDNTLFEKGGVLNVTAKYLIYIYAYIKQTKQKQTPTTTSQREPSLQLRIFPVCCLLSSDLGISIKGIGSWFLGLFACEINLCTMGQDFYASDVYLIICPSSCCQELCC